MPAVIDLDALTKELHEAPETLVDQEDREGCSRSSCLCWPEASIPYCGTLILTSLIYTIRPGWPGMSRSAADGNIS